MSDNLGYLSSDAVRLAFIFVCGICVCKHVCVLAVLLHRLLAVFFLLLVPSSSSSFLKQDFSLDLELTD